MPHIPWSADAEMETDVCVMLTMFRIMAHYSREGLYDGYGLFIDESHNYGF